MLGKRLSMLAALASATLAPAAGLAQLSDDVVKIGVLTDMNGPASTPTGQGSVTAAQMAIDDFGGKVWASRSRSSSATTSSRPTSAPASRGAGTTSTRSI